jgi:hypothetical protein
MSVIRFSPFVVFLNLFDCMFLQLFCLCFGCWALASFLVGLLFLLAKRKSGWGMRVVFVGSLCDGFDEWPLYM